jgi:hypothetical protein
MTIEQRGNLLLRSPKTDSPSSPQRSAHLAQLATIFSRQQQYRDTVLPFPYKVTGHRVCYKKIKAKIRFNRNQSCDKDNMTNQKRKELGK